MGENSRRNPPHTYALVNYVCNISRSLGLWFQRTVRKCLIDSLSVLRGKYLALLFLWTCLKRRVKCIYHHDYVCIWWQLNWPVCSIEIVKLQMGFLRKQRLTLMQDQFNYHWCCDDLTLYSALIFCSWPGLTWHHYANMYRPQSWCAIGQLLC